ncbi:MAG: PQQ-dependent sugar dehydrogenase [Thermoleophilia bacterium]|nr:PQQ-dependent sugar dehydrogenase [Thermoleophilia bacterium]
MTLAVLIAAVVIVALAALALWPAGEPADPGSQAGTTDGATDPEGPPPAESPERGPAPPAVTLELVAGGLAQPIYVGTPPGDPRLFIVERAGLVLVYEDGRVRPRPFLDLRDRVSTGGERGLLSLAFHPEFAANGRLYVNFTDTAGATRVVEYVTTDDGRAADPASASVLLTVDQPYANHNGGQIQVGPDGLLYVGMGDGGGAGDPDDTAQDDGSRLGKLLRIGLGASPSGWQAFAKGLRNPWRFSFDRVTGDLWIADVGQNAIEEVNRLPAGREPQVNFGWPAYEGSALYRREVADDLDREALEWPVVEYTHAEGRSITGGYVYRGAALPELRGWYVFGDYVSGRVWAFDPASGARVPLADADGRIEQLVSFGEDGAGELYAVSLTGTVYRIAPAR